MRFSDVCRISKQNFFEQNGRQYLYYTSMKTGIEATLPVKARAL
jgi:hypothetical protein